MKIKNKLLIMGGLVFLSSLTHHASAASQRWKAIGPDGVSIEHYYSFQMSHSNPDMLYLRSGRNLFKSVDGSTHWDVVKKGHEGNVTGQLLIDPINPQILFSMFTPRGNLSSLPSTLYRSLDGGVHWSRYFNFSTLAAYHSASLFSLNYFGYPQLVRQSNDRNSLLNSSDGGESWLTLVDSLQRDIDIVTIDPHNSDIVYGVHQSNALHKSIDAGKTWVEIETWGNGSRFEKLQIHPADSNLLFISLSSTQIISSSSVVKKSENGGEEWVTLKSPDRYFFDKISMSASNVDVLYATLYTYAKELSDIVIAKSTDGGNSWSIKPTGLSSQNYILNPTPAPKPTLIVHPQNDQLLFLATLHGILNSTNGGQDWQLNKMGLKHVGGQLSVAKNDSSLMYLASGEVHYKSVNAGVSWEQFKVGLSNESCNRFSINPAVNSEVLCLVKDKLYKSTDSGSRWEFVKEFDSALRWPTSNRISASYSSDGRVIYVNHLNGVSQSSDSGITWTVTDISQANEYTVQWLATDPIKSHIVYALALEQVPAYQFQSVLYKSIDKGAHWEKKLSASALKVVKVVIDSTRSDRLISWSGGGYSSLSLSTNGGDSWISLARSSPVARGNMEVAFNPKNPKGLFLLNENGVFETEDLESWSLMQKGANGSFSASSDNIYLVSPSSILRLDPFVVSEESKKCLFTWAEQTYPQLLSPAGVQSQVLGDYTYRYYSQSNNYLGFFQDKEVHFLQPSVSADIQNVGLVEYYQNLSGCY